MSEFDGEHLRLRRQKLHLDWRLALGDLRLLTLYQELLLLKDLERREESVQAKLDDCMREENEITVGGWLAPARLLDSDLFTQ